MQRRMGLARPSFRMNARVHIRRAAWVAVHAGGAGGAPPLLSPQVDYLVYSPTNLSLPLWITLQTPGHILTPLRPPLKPRCVVANQPLLAPPGDPFWTPFMPLFGDPFGALFAPPPPLELALGPLWPPFGTLFGTQFRHLLGPFLGPLLEPSWDPSPHSVHI